MPSKHLLRREKTGGGLEKMTCKTMKQDENDQNYKKESTPVVDNKPNGKSQLSSWFSMGTFTAPFNGQITNIDLSPPQPNAFYRLKQD